MSKCSPYAWSSTRAPRVPRSPAPVHHIAGLHFASPRLLLVFQRLEEDCLVRAGCCPEGVCPRVGHGKRLPGCTSDGA